MTQRRRGFTLVEMMVVVAIIGIVAAIAVVSLRRSRSTDDADAWASAVRNMVAQTRSRALSTKQVYLLQVSAKQLQWCQVTLDSNSSCNVINGCATPITTCPNSTAGTENGVAMNAGADAVTDSTWAGMDIMSTAGAVPAVVRSSSLPAAIYFGPTGTVDTTVLPVIQGTGGGVTIYVRASNSVPGTTSSANQKRRRIVVYGPSGRPRIIDNWQ